MKALIGFLLGAVGVVLFQAAALEAPVRGATVELNPYQIEQCRKEGGCVVVSKEQAQAWRADAFERGVRHARTECRRFM